MKRTGSLPYRTLLLLNGLLAVSAVIGVISRDQSSPAVPAATDSRIGETLLRAEARGWYEGYAGIIENVPDDDAAVLEAFFDSRPETEDHARWSDLGRSNPQNKSMRERWTGPILWSVEGLSPEQIETVRELGMMTRVEASQLGLPAELKKFYQLVRSPHNRRFLHVIDKAMKPDFILGGVTIDRVTGSWWCWSIIPRS